MNVISFAPACGGESGIETPLDINVCEKQVWVKGVKDCTATNKCNYCHLQDPFDSTIPHQILSQHFHHLVERREKEKQATQKRKLARLRVSAFET